MRLSVRAARTLLWLATPLAALVATPLPAAGGNLTLRSQSFTDGGEIPKRFTCEGEDLSPALAWTGVPADTKSLALIVDDPDAPDPAAPKKIFVHWVLYALPPSASELPAGVPQNALPAGTREGLNDKKQTAYFGPCPPIGRHRYRHHLYALDTELDGLTTPSRAELDRAMEGHILDQTVLTGTYQKSGDR
jgi:Raf kinase inhibitor-like YbhB/YbcL family protein